MTEVFKIKTVTFLIFCILVIGALALSFKQDVSGYCSSNASNLDSVKVRDWVVENPFSSGLVFSLFSLNGSDFGSGGVIAEERDPYAVGFNAYCLNVKHAAKIHKAGKGLGYLIIFMIVFFGLTVLTRKLKEAIKRK